MSSLFVAGRTGRRRVLSVLLAVLVVLTVALPAVSAGTATGAGPAMVAAKQGPATVKTQKNKKKPKKCRFARSKQTWTLKRSCTLTKPLVLPAGITLNGKNKTMKLAASAGVVDPGIIQITGGSGNVRNLVLDGAGLGDVPPGQANTYAPIIAIYFSQSTISNVTIRGADYRFIKIVQTGTDGRAVSLDRVTGIGGIAIEADRADTSTTVTITDSAVLGAALPAAISWRGGSGTVTDTVISGRAAGISMVLQATIDLDQVTITDAWMGVEVSDGSTAQVSNSSLTGRGTENSTENSIRGVMFGPNSAGGVRGTTITDYNGVGHGDQDGCGIAILPSASDDITLANNTLTNNKVEVCDPPA